MTMTKQEALPKEVWVAKFDFSKTFIAHSSSSGHVYTCLFVNIEIKTFWQHSQKSGLAILKSICCQHGLLSR